MNVTPIDQMPRSLDEIAAAHTAASDRTPSTVLKAFLPNVSRMAEIVLQPLTIKTWMLLEKIESPFVKTKPDTTIGLSEILPTLYILTQPIEQVERALDLAPGWCLPDFSQPVEPISAQGKESWSLVITGFAQSLPMRHLLTMGEAIAAHIAAEFAPSASLAPPSKDGESPLSVSAPGTAAEAP